MKRRFSSLAFSVFLLSVFGNSLGVAADAPTCVIKYGQRQFDLSALDWTFPVLVSDKYDKRNSSYYISLCRPVTEGPYGQSLPKECEGGIACAVSDKPTSSTSDDAVMRYGNFTKGNAPVIRVTETQGELVLSIYGPSCEFGEAAITIYAECGTHLGSPEPSFMLPCVAYFVWKSSVFCKDSGKNTRKEVPCYVYDGNKRIDLTPLIQTQGGHHVETEGVDHVDDMIINVCSNLVMDPKAPSLSCSGNAGACVKIDGQFQPAGSVSSSLEFVKDGLVKLVYNNSDVVRSGCPTKPQTTIYFQCPRRRLSHPPKLVSASGCHYEVLWETELACPRENLHGDARECKFSSTEEGIQIDLSPLKKSTGDYVVPGLVNNDTVHFYLNPCRPVSNSDCSGSWKSVAACMKDSQNKTTKLGVMLDASLSYVNGKIYLTYGGGEKCANRSMRQEMIIEFTCDENAGNGKPVFVSEQDCIYYFVWKTKHACAQRGSEGGGSRCYVPIGNTVIDLSVLKESSVNEQWESRYAIDRDEREIFINVCGQIPKDNKFQGCNSGGASACMIRAGKQVSLGQFMSPPSYVPDSKKVQLTYENGDSCSGAKRIRSVLLLECAPGNLLRSPVLVDVSEEGCLYVFEWKTAAACPLSPAIGKDCVIFDKQLGLRFDLNPLAARGRYRKITSLDYDYYLNVCADLVGSPCRDDAQMCQVDKKSGAVFSLGRESRDVLYMDRAVRMKFVGGSPFHDKEKTPRSATITFLCDPDAGDGRPLLSGDSVEPHYAFQWYTSRVCPHVVSEPLSVNCFLKKNGSDYDFTGLSSQDWVVYDDQLMPPYRVKFYISMCRPVRLNSFCAAEAAACATKVHEDGTEVEYIRNLGRVASPQANALFWMGSASVTYSNGETCTAFGKTEAYTTKIYFTCSEKEQSPRLMSKTGCRYLFLWPTPTVCPAKNSTVQGSSCAVRDPVTGFVYDLRDLRLPEGKDPYSVNGGGNTYQVNICGPLTSGPCAKEGASVCEASMDHSQGTPIGLADTAVLTKKGWLQMSLRGKKDPSSGLLPKVLIQFRCFLADEIRDLRTVELKSVKKLSSAEYVFEMLTPLACGLRTDLCSFVDQRSSNQYDLTPLARGDSNWQVSVPTSSGLTTYLLNFCRPLYKPFNGTSEASSCPGPDTAACRIEGKTAISLGWQNRKPIVNAAGTLTITYSWGSVFQCRNYDSRAIVTLSCHNTESLTFIGETGQCDYLFAMQTPAACPLQSSVGSNCAVTDPHYHNTYDLSGLRRRGSDYDVFGAEHTYLINVCGPLENPPEQCAGSAACQMEEWKQSRNVSAGLPNGNLIFRNGLLQLVYRSGQANCHSLYNRTTVINFMCDHTTDGRKEGPKFILEDEECTYIFDWHTSLACPPYRELEECKTTDDKGRAYNLEALSLSDGNYEVFQSGVRGKKFVLNVCRNVVHRPDARCPYTSAACLIEKNETSGEFLRAHNLGQLSGKPTFEDGFLQLRYTSGDACTVKGQEGVKMQTVIKFICEKYARFGEPEFESQEGCTFYFRWTTRDACPLSVVPDVPVPSGFSNCSAINPETGFHVDLSPLMQHNPYVVRDEGRHQYKLSVCTGLNQTQDEQKCQSGAGLCQYETGGEMRSWSGGMANAKLHYRRRGVYVLNYTGGDLCHEDRFQRSTVITFVCGSDRHGLGLPIFIDESDNCTYLFEWHTDLVCEEQVHCTVDVDDYKVDLSQLTLTEGHYTAFSKDNDDWRFFINVCRPLNPVVKEKCPPGSGICLMKSYFGDGLSLGHNEKPPIVDFEGHVTLLYTGGSPCDINPKYNYSSRIIFICDPTVLKGSPVQRAFIADHCSFVFEWKTSVVCKPRDPEPVVNTCTYSDPKSGLSFNLSSLRRDPSNPYRVGVRDVKNTTLLVNVCGGVSECAPASGKAVSVCSKRPAPAAGEVVRRYGMLGNNETFVYNGKKLILKYTSDESCPSSASGQRTAKIVFTCDRNASSSQPVIDYHYPCSTSLVWHTDLVCTAATTKCIVENMNGSVYSLKPLSSITHAWYLTDAQGNEYWINVCGTVPRSVGCESSRAAACLRKKGGKKIFSLGALSTQNLLVDGDGSLVLSYQFGNGEACGSADDTSSVLITFRCGTRLGEPRLLHSSKHCVFRFIWETSAACPVQSDVLMPEKGGILYDERLQGGWNLTEMLAKSFTVEERTPDRRFNYIINLGGSSVGHETCSQAAVCQTKPDGSFFRDIGTADTRKFVLKGNELLVHLTSRGRECGKNRLRNVTTLIYLQCSSAAGMGQPYFLYESNDCDYVFTWDTDAVCPKNLIPLPTGIPEKHTGQPGSSGGHTVTIVLVLLVIVSLCLALALVVAKKERRDYVLYKSRQMCCGLRPFSFRYRRLATSPEEGEALLLSPDGQGLWKNSDAMDSSDSDVDLLT